MTLRLFPIRYRNLPTDRQFDRFDLVELDMELPRDDYRPESRHVIEDSIRIVGHGRDLSDAAKVGLWKPFIAPTLKALHDENKTTKRSFGIVKPDEVSVKFFVKPAKDVDADGQALNEAAYQQASLFEAPLAKLPKTEYAFGYRFTSGGHAHEHLIHDGEVQAAYIAYRRRYGDGALDMLKQEYGERIPPRNLHFILGTMKAHRTPSSSSGCCARRSVPMIWTSSRAYSETASRRVPRTFLAPLPEPFSPHIQTPTQCRSTRPPHPAPLRRCSSTFRVMTR